MFARTITVISFSGNKKLCFPQRLEGSKKFIFSVFNLESLRLRGKSNVFGQSAPGGDPITGFTNELKLQMLKVKDKSSIKNLSSSDTGSHLEKIKK